MNIANRIFGTLCCAVTLALLAPAAASAQDWPTGPVTFVVPQPPGSPLEIMARPMAQKLQEKWGKPVLVESKAGATGTIGANFVVRAAPDGHTFLYAPDLPITTAPSLLKVPYDPVNDLELIAIFGEIEMMLLAHPSVGAKSLADVVAKAKAAPGKLNYSTGGVASPAHFCGELVRQATGAEIVHVPYRGAAPAIQALLAGEVTLSCGPVTLALPHIRAGTIVAIGTTGPARNPLTPDVPTLSEAGVKDIVMAPPMFFMAPKGIPAELLARVKADFKAVLDDPDTQKRFAALGVAPKWITGQDGTALIRRDLARWAEIIKTGNIKAE